MHRLFFALWPDDQLRRRIRQVAVGLGLRGGRVTHPEDLHLTLVFLGALDPQRSRCAEEAAAGIAMAPFHVALDRVGAFPRAGVVWLGCRSTPPALAALVDDLQTRLAACGMPREARPYEPHVTLQRKAPRPLSQDLDPALDWAVDRFCLLRSAGEAPGPRYTVVNSWMLHPAA